MPPQHLCHYCKPVAAGRMGILQVWMRFVTANITRVVREVGERGKTQRTRAEPNKYFEMGHSQVKLWLLRVRQVWIRQEPCLAPLSLGSFPVLWVPRPFRVTLFVAFLIALHDNMPLHLFTTLITSLTFMYIRITKKKV